MNAGTPGPRTGSRSAILDVIRAAGTISRVELTRATGLTAATVSTVVRRLLDEGLVVEAGRAESTGGKPRMLLQLDPDAGYAVGVHLDHAGITYVIANLGGQVVARWRRPGAGSDDPRDVVGRIAAEVAATTARVGVDGDRLLGVGVVSPGPLSTTTGMTLAPPVMQHWADFPLAEAIEDAVGLPVLLDNDATAAALGEYWSGGVPTGAVCAALYMGTGIGAGIIVDGTVYRGRSSNAGEIGHVCVDVDGPPCWCGSRGCVEVFAGPAAVVARAAEAGIALPGRGVSEDFAALARAAARGEEEPARLLGESARYLAAAAQVLANVLDLDLLVLTGASFAQAGSLYLPVVQQRLADGFFARATHPVRVTISSQASEAAALGGAALVLQAEVAPRQAGMRMVVDTLTELPAGSGVA
ncbi:ROK family transcriptional regulator [Cellulomonas sp. zg-ZUI222]|uniref:ROK family transcriptional regulator n=1 Tax=Cellulomonas wangleii TaxID=2816956 RepID=A0ABX8D7G7_9CELL|nr:MULTISPECIES: ROK family transcriptional regulator [Cellulomonas]MBO0901075.1 ROK family transcriptional regulator [Cellulomonas sp. zg-ZUI22]MBO0921734.1 ROK family transcriptional regulator [Cellulomonas wangleii]MBO0925223.1 ROK family transcriptional regulator [Cellulomonas wangleii]QVI63381.1 ROK family transcriptional regulator [Cellulomonas wangleii]